jgi:hypothetical protein
MMSGIQEIWEQYKCLLETEAYEAWGDLWTDNGQFIIAYGKEHVGEEAYKGRESIVSFFSGSRGKVKMYFENDVLQETKNRDIFFVTFDFNAILTASGHHYQNHIVCQFTLDKAGKIKELMEYADPIKRQALLEELGVRNSPAKVVNLEKKADILQSLFKHYYEMAMDHHSKAGTTSNILLIIVAAVIGLVGLDNKVGGSLDILCGFAVAIVGLFGVVWCWKQHERYHFWEYVAKKYLRELVKIGELPDRGDLSRDPYLEEAREHTAQKFGPRFAQIDDRYLWVTLHFFVVLLGMGLMLAA